MNIPNEYWKILGSAFQKQTEWYRADIIRYFIGSYPNSWNAEQKNYYQYEVRYIDMLLGKFCEDGYLVKQRDGNKVKYIAQPLLTALILEKLCSFGNKYQDEYMRKWKA